MNEENDPKLLAKAKAQAKRQLTFDWDSDEYNERFEVHAYELRNGVLVYERRYLLTASERRGMAHVRGVVRDVLRDSEFREQLEAPREEPPDLEDDDGR